MTTLADNIPGWFKRKAGSDDETAQNESSTSSTASVTTGGGSDREPVVVWEAANVMEAQVVKGRLESEGIPAFVRSEALGFIYGLSTFGLASADVLVPGPLAEKAIDILYPDEELEAAEDQTAKDQTAKDQTAKDQPDVQNDDASPHSARSDTSKNET